MHLKQELLESERPRERLRRLGAKALSDTEILALVLGVGTVRENAVSLARRILREKSLRDIAKNAPQALERIDGIGPAKAAKIVACFELGKRTLQVKKKRTLITSAQSVARLAIPEIGHSDQEHVLAYYLSTRKHVLSSKILFIGTLNANVVHPREIFQEALAQHAAGVILVHNHPSGDPTPSEEDVLVTEQIARAGLLLGIELIDHVIVTNRSYFSFKKKGLL